MQILYMLPCPCRDSKLSLLMVSQRGFPSCTRTHLILPTQLLTMLWQSCMEQQVPGRLDESVGIRQFLWTNHICSSSYNNKNLKLTCKLDMSEEQLFLFCCFADQCVTQLVKGFLFCKPLLWSENSKTITLFKQHTPLKEGLSRNKPITKINKKRKANQQKPPRNLTVTSLDPGRVVWTHNSVPDTCCKITSLLAVPLSLIKQCVTAVQLKVMCICYLELFYE